MNATSERKAYGTPRLVTHGSVAKLTQHGGKPKGPTYHPPQGPPPGRPRGPKRSG